MKKRIVGLFMRWLEVQMEERIAAAAADRTKQLTDVAQRAMQVAALAERRYQALPAALAAELEKVHALPDCTGPVWNAICAALHRGEHRALVIARGQAKPAFNTEATEKHGEMVDWQTVRSPGLGVPIKWGDKWVMVTEAPTSK